MRLLRPGTIVLVDRTRYRKELYQNRIFIAKIVGYDLGHTKYEVGMRFIRDEDQPTNPKYFMNGGSWVFPNDVTEIPAHDEILRLSAEEIFRLLKLKSELSTS